MAKAKKNTASNSGGQQGIDLGQVLGGGNSGAAASTPQSQDTLDVRHPDNAGTFQDWLLGNGSGDGGSGDDQISGAFNSWHQGDAQPEQVQEAATHVVASLPPNERSNFVQQLLTVFAQNGIDPAQAGVQQTNPQQMSSSDVGRLLGFAQQQAPELLQQLFGSASFMNNPVVRMVLSGILAYVAQQFLGNIGSGDASQPAYGNQGFPQTTAPQDSGQTGGLDLGQIINMFLGGGK